MYASCNFAPHQGTKRWQDEREFLLSCYYYYDYLYYYMFSVPYPNYFHHPYLELRTIHLATVLMLLAYL